MFNSGHSNNPVLRSEAFRSSEYGSEAMTMQGVINKTALLLAVTFAFAAVSWIKAPAFSHILNGGTYFIIAILTIGLAVVTYMKPALAQFTAPAYCAAQGFVFGLISRAAEMMYPGIVFNALFLTFAILGIMLYAYRTGMVRATPQLQKVLGFGLTAYFGVMIVQFILSFFGSGIPGIFGSGPIGIGFSLLVVGMASFFLVLDFDEIETLVRERAPKQMEWLGAFGLMITLIWLYIEVLKLLMKLQSSDD